MEVLSATYRHRIKNIILLSILLLTLIWTIAYLSSIKSCKAISEIKLSESQGVLFRKMYSMKCGGFRSQWTNESKNAWHMVHHHDTLIASEFHEWPTGHINTLRPRLNVRHFADDIFKCIFLNGDTWIPINISLMFDPKGQINNTPALVKTMAWRRPGDKSSSEPMLVILLTHICITRPQSVNCDVLPKLCH